MHLHAEFEEVKSDSTGPSWLKVVVSWFDLNPSGPSWHPGRLAPFGGPSSWKACGMMIHAAILVNEETSTIFRPAQGNAPV